jgi:hypothetical protein
MSQPTATLREMDLVTMQVVDWEGPIVEILFRRPLAAATDIAELLRETRSFMEETLVSAGKAKAYFLTCYDHFSVPRELAHALQEAFLEFNGRYSKGDVRYGGTLVAKTLVISTAIRSESASEMYATRDEALASLRTRHRAAR